MHLNVNFNTKLFLQNMWNPAKLRRVSAFNEYLPSSAPASCFAVQNVADRALKLCQC